MSPKIFETARLVIRPFTLDDTPTIHRIMDQAFGDGTQVSDPAALNERQSWVRWSILSHEWFANLYQPPYGERAIVLKDSNTLVGSIGYVPCLAPYGQYPALRSTIEPSGFVTPEVGLFWVIDPAQQQRGYATEAGQAMIQHAFRNLRLERIIATTEYSNIPSQRVMHKLGMDVLRNPLPDPAWLQIVGVLRNLGDVETE